MEDRRTLPTPSFIQLPHWVVAAGTVFVLLLVVLLYWMIIYILNLHKMPTHWLSFENGLGMAIGLFGLMIGAAALVAGLRTDRKVSSQLDEMHSLAQAMPTRYIGPFPDHLDHILSLIDDTRSGGDLRIMTDCADYGSFYDPQRYQKVHGALLEAAYRRNVTIRYLVCGSLRSFTRESQFTGIAIKDALSNPKFLAKFETFRTSLAQSAFKTWITRLADDQREQESLVTWLTRNCAPPSILEKVSDAIAGCKSVCMPGFNISPDDEQHCLGVQLLPICVEMKNELSLSGRIDDFVRAKSVAAPFLLWLRDSKQDGEAIFVLPSAPRAERGGIGFRTFDQSLIAAMKSVFDDLFEKARLDGRAVSGKAEDSPQIPDSAVTPAEEQSLALA